LIALVIFFSAYRAFPAEQSLSFLPYNSDKETADYASVITAGVIKGSSSSAAVQDPASPQIKIPADEKDQDAIDCIVRIGKSSKTDLIGAGQITKTDNYYYADTCIISVEDKKIVYRSVLPIKIADKDYDPAFDIVGRIRFFIEKKSFPVGNLNVSQGASSAYAKITWEKVPECSIYEVLSSTVSEKGPFVSAGMPSVASFEDTAAKPGVKTWYAVSPIINGVKAEPSSAIAGYRKPAMPKDEDLRTLLYSFNKPRPQMSDAEAKKSREDITYIGQFYQNSTKLNLILYMARDYLQKKQLFTFRTSGNYEMDWNAKQIKITPAGGKYVIFFENGRFFRLIVDRKDADLTDRLIRNAVFFCTANGEVETKSETGETIYIPRFDGVTMCTTYFHDTQEWNSSTLLFMTSNQTLKVKIETEKKKVEDQNDNGDEK